MPISNYLPTKNDYGHTMWQKNNKYRHMKKMILLMLLIGGLTTVQKAGAQININLGLQPAGGPAGYQYVDYYYLPDIETYYYVPSKQFIYLNNGKWI